MDAILVGRIIRRRLVIGAAGVPNDDGALAPLVAVAASWREHVSGQLLDKIVTLNRLQTFDRNDLPRVKIKPNAFRLRMSTQDRVHNRRPVSIFRIE